MDDRHGPSGRLRPFADLVVLEPYRAYQGRGILTYVTTERPGLSRVSSAIYFDMMGKNEFTLEAAPADWEATRRCPDLLICHTSSIDAAVDRRLDAAHRARVEGGRVGALARAAASACSSGSAR